MRINRSITTKFFIAGLFIFCCYIGIKNFSPPKEVDSPIYKLSEFEKSQLQTGDIILRRGYGFVSNMILNMMNEDYKVTHLGVILRNGDTLKVAHALSSKVSNQDGLRFQNLDNFVYHSKDSSLLVTRLKGIDSTKQAKIAEQLKLYLDMQLPFDHKFDYQDTTEHYCSELIWRIYEHNLGILNVADSITEEEKYNALKVFYNLDYFDIVLSHHD